MTRLMGRMAGAPQFRNTVGGPAEAVQRRDIVELDAKLSEVDRSELAARGVASPVSRGLEDPQRPLGVTALFDQMVTDPEYRTFDDIIASLEATLDFLQKNAATLPPELVNIGAATVQDELRRQKKAINITRRAVEI